MTNQEKKVLSDEQIEMIFKSCVLKVDGESVNFNIFNFARAILAAQEALNGSSEPCRTPVNKN